MSTPAPATVEGQDTHHHEAASPANSSESASRDPSPTTSGDQQKEPDASERPVRQQLKKTTLAAANGTSTVLEQAKPEDALSESGSVATDLDKSDKDGEGSSTRGRPRRKRSFEELGVEHADERTGTSASKHLRKRSREGENEDVKSGREDTKDFSSRTPSPDKTDPAEPTDSAQAVELTERDATAPEQPLTPPADLAGSVPADDMVTSPQNKRSRDQFVKDNDPTSESSKVEGEADASADLPEPVKDTLAPPKTLGDEPDSKRPREGAILEPEKDKTNESGKISPTSGFANTSSTSPFAALGSPKSSSAIAPASPSAFKSSGFASFANSAQSPFGTFGAKPPSDDAQSKADSSTKDSPAPSGFGALGGSGPSPFAAAAPTTFASQSGFAKLSNGFGASSGFGSGKPLSSFATPGSAGIIGASSKGPKPIGVSKEEEDNGDDGDSGNEALENGDAIFASAEDDEKDSRFFEQDLETGEEGEETIYTSRAKLYVSQDKQWKERGVGVLKLNVARSDWADSDADEQKKKKKTARFLMRADGSHRVVLNTPVKKEISLTDPSGGPPKGKTAIFLAFVDDQPTMMQIKVRSNTQALELHGVVNTLQKTL